MARRPAIAAQEAPGESEGRIRAKNEKLILEEAVRLFSTKGFDGTTISEIAEASGLPKANVYYYFQSKTGIYERLIAEVFRYWDAALLHIRADRDPREALRAYIHEKLAAYRRNAAQSRFFAAELLRGGGFLSPAQKKHMQDVTREACQAVEQWIAEGRFAPVDPRHFFIMLWATTQFYSDFSTIAAATLGVSKLRKLDCDEAEEQILRILDSSMFRS